MRAVVMGEFGPPAVLVMAQVPDPAAGPGQVVVEVEYAGITFIETLVRAGRAPYPAMAPQLPAVPGNGVGGVVAAVGEGVDAALVGTRVVTTTGGTGGYAERVVVPAAGLVVVPNRVDLADATALLADGRTALALVRAAAPRPGETVLVDAAAGGLGSLLVQLTAAAGGRVVAAAGGPRKVGLAVELGAARGLDYSEPDWAERAGEEVDLVFDGVGGGVARAAFGLLRRGGRCFAFGLASGTFAPITDQEAADRGVTVVRGVRVDPAEMADLSRMALAEAAAGRLHPVIGQTFPLERAAEAHAAMEARATLGKTLLVAGGR